MQHTLIVDGVTKWTESFAIGSIIEIEPSNCRYYYVLDKSVSYNDYPPASQKGIGSTLYVTESSGDVAYTVIAHNYNGSGNTLLMRPTSCSSVKFWYSAPGGANYSRYDNSNADNTVNTFYNGLPQDTKSKIVSTAVPCRLNATDYTTISNITRYAFMLSTREVFDDGNEGTHLSYFESNDYPINAWLRTVLPANNGVACHTDDSGNVASSNTNWQKNIYPCFCVSGRQTVTVSGNTKHL